MAHRVEHRVLGTSATTGTGAKTLDATAVTGHRTVQGAPIAVNDTFFAYAEAVDASGNAAGKFQLGHATYSATDVVTFSSVLRSSNANAAENFLLNGAAGEGTSLRVGIAAWFGQVQAEALAANQNNWAPTDLYLAARIDITPTVAVLITGLAATFDGHRITLANTSARQAGFCMALVPESASSTAANRFAMPAGAPMWLLPGDSCVLQYCAALARWTLISASSVEMPAHNSKLSGLGEGRVAFWEPLPNATAPTAVGIAAPATGTATAAAVANTSAQTRSRRFENLVTAAAATAVAGVRGANLFMYRGDAAGRGGFLARMRGGPATGVANATTRFFMGLRGNNGAPTDVEPSSLIDLLGLAFDAADANLQWMHNDGSGTATKVSLGIAIPTTDRSAWYEISIYCAPNGTTIHYEFINLSDGTVLVGSVLADIPAATIFMTPLIYSSVGGVSSVIGIAAGGSRFFTNY